jgi:retron-type reverse transcriptase
MHEVMEPLFEPAFYAHSYACRPGRGTHAAVGKLQSWFSAHPDQYFLKLDVSKYFPSIDRAVLFERISKTIGDEKFLGLIGSLLDKAPGGRGIPIGNLTSQLFANVYLDVLDQHIKRTMRLPHYIRYMDDIVLLADSRSQIGEWRSEIEAFASTRLKLRFHPHKAQIGRTSEGVPFVGYHVTPEGLRLRGKSFRRFRKRLGRKMTLDARVKCLLSYLGHARHVRHADQVSATLVRAAFREGVTMT